MYIIDRGMYINNRDMYIIDRGMYINNRELYNKTYIYDMIGIDMKDKAWVMDRSRMEGKKIKVLGDLRK